MRIQDFLGLYSNENSKGVFRAGLYNFLDCMYGPVRKGSRATKDEKEEYERLADKYFEEDRDYFNDLLDFVGYMNKYPPTGAKTKINGVKEFLIHNDVEFSHKQLKRLRGKMPKGKTARTAEKDLDHDMLKKILNHTDLKLRSVILTLASSGMRIGELLQIELPDVDLEKSPAQIVVRGENTKSGDTRTVFVSKEAQETLKEWLKHRDSYLGSAMNRHNGLKESVGAKDKKLDDNRLFPFSERNIRYMWEIALKKAGYFNKDKTTNRTDVRIHALRKFFRSQLALSCPLDIVEALMGHEGYLTDAYRRYSLKQMGEYYQKAEHLVTISMPKEIQEMENEFKGEIDKHRKIMEDLFLENKEFKQTAEELRQKNVELEKQLNRVDKQLQDLFSVIPPEEVKERIKKFNLPPSSNYE